MFPGHEPTLVYKDKSHLEAGISSGIYNQLTVNHTFYSEKKKKETKHFTQQLCSV